MHIKGHSNLIALGTTPPSSGGSLVWRMRRVSGARNICMYQKELGFVFNWRGTGAHQSGPVTVSAQRLFFFCHSYQMMPQNFSKNQDNFFTTIFIYRICRRVGEVVLLKSKRDEFWTNSQFSPIVYQLSYIMLIPQFL